jgi:flagellar hook-basal body complex protein FliE
MTLPVAAIGEALSHAALSGLSPGETPSASAVGGIAEPTGVGSASAATGVEGAGSSTGGFGGALTQAISALEQSQQSASGAAQALATGTAANPESAVVTVEDAQLAMQLASQVRNKAVEGVQQLFQTQL